MLLVEVDFIPYQHRIEYKEKEDMPNGSSLSTLDFWIMFRLLFHTLKVYYLPKRILFD